MKEFMLIIKNSIISHTEEKEISENMKLIDDLGMTSLDMMILLCKLEKIYNKKVQVVDLVRAETVNDLYNIFRDK